MTASRSSRPTSAKSKPSKLVSLLILLVLVIVGYEQWPRIREFLAELSGAYGGSKGVLDTNFYNTASIGKTAVARYWSTNSRPPSSNAQAGLEPGDSYRGGTLLRMEVIDGGNILFVFDAKSGVLNGQVTLVPDAAGLMQGIIKWSCITPSYPNQPDCAYRP